MDMAGPPVEVPTASFMSMSMAEPEMFPNIVFTLPPFFLFFYCHPCELCKNCQRWHIVIDNCLPVLNPFLFIRGFSCPSYIQASLSLNCLKLPIPGFPHNCFPVSCDDIGFLKNPTSRIGLEIRPQSFFSAFRALLHSANYSVEWSGRCDSPLKIVMAFWRTIICQRRAVSPDPESLNSNKKGAKLPLLSAEGCHTQMDG